jgi:hypothetical protein
VTCADDVAQHGFTATDALLELGRSEDQYVAVIAQPRAYGVRHLHTAVPAVRRDDRKIDVAGRAGFALCDRPELRCFQRRLSPAEAEALIADSEGGGRAGELARIYGIRRTTLPAHVSGAGKTRGQLTTAQVGEGGAAL